MTGQVSSWLLQFYLLLLMVQPLDPSNHPGQGTGASGPDAMELEDMDPELIPWMNMASMSWTCFLMELLITGIVLGYYLCRRLRRGQREKEHQSPSAQAGQGCCPKHGCPTKLIELLRHNRDMLKLCLHHHSQQKAKAKRAGKGAVSKKKKRFQAFPQR